MHFALHDCYTSLATCSIFSCKAGFEPATNRSFGDPIRYTVSALLPASQSLASHSETFSSGIRSFILSFYNTNGLQPFDRHYKIRLVVHNNINIFVSKTAFLGHICFIFLAEDHALLL